MGVIKEFEYNGSYMPYAVVTCILSLILFKINIQLAARMFPKVKTFSVEDKISLGERATSLYHAAVVLPMCVYAFFIEELNENPIWWDCTIVRTSCAIVVGFTLSDTILVLVHFKESGGSLYFFHHFASIYAYFYVMSYGVLPYFANFRLLAEFSTPFVNLRWFFDAMGFSRKLPFVIINAITMTGTFFAFRILAIPVYWYKVYTVYGTEEFIRTGHVQFVLLLTCLILDILNIYWFNLMCKGLFKAIANLSKPVENVKSQ